MQTATPCRMMESFRTHGRVAPFVQPFRCYFHDSCESLLLMQEPHCFCVPGTKIRDSSQSDEMSSRRLLIQSLAAASCAARLDPTCTADSMRYHHFQISLLTGGLFQGLRGGTLWLGCCGIWRDNANTLIG